MARELDDRPPPLPVLARRLAAQIGRNFSETISALIKHGGDADAVVRHFLERDEKEEKSAVAARRRRRRDETVAPAPEPPAPEFEPLAITKSEAWPTVDPHPMPRMRGICLPPPDNGGYIAEAVAWGRLSRVMVVTARGARTVYASPGFAKYLSGTVGDK
jgi:hypothetical protein